MSIYKTADELREELEEKQKRYAELEAGENTDSYDEALDAEGPVKVGGLEYMPSHILKEVDPTAYRCGLNDYNDSEMSDLESEIDDLKKELADAEAEEKEATE